MRYRRPEIFANFDIEGEQRLLLDMKQQAVTEWNVALSADVDRARECGISGRELSHFIELAIIRQVGLRDYASYTASSNHRRAIEQKMIDAQGQADHCHNAEAPRCLHYFPQRIMRCIKKRSLMKKILTGICRQ